MSEVGRDAVFLVAVEAMDALLVHAADARRSYNKRVGNADGPDGGEVIAQVLATVAARHGSSDWLTAGRPGSWEASFVDQLVKGTVGYGDEYLVEHLETDRITD